MNKHHDDVFNWKMETISVLLTLCAGNSLVTGEFSSHMPVTRSFDASFELGLNKRLSKQSRWRWFETPSRSSWRHCNVDGKLLSIYKSQIACVCVCVCVILAIPIATSPCLIYQFLPEIVITFIDILIVFRYFLLKLTHDTLWTTLHWQLVTLQLAGKFEFGSQLT